jgi:DNA-binding transcriptional regulator YdaS (Cro superfamily)
MQLADYLETYRIKRIVFAERIGVSPQTITGYCDGKFWPSRKKAKKIFEVTDGEVTPLDLMTAGDEVAQ